MRGGKGLKYMKSYKEEKLSDLIVVGFISLR